MVDPSNRTTRYAFSNRFDASESLLLQSDYFTAGDTSAVVRTEASAYALPAADGSSPWPWPAMLGRSQILAVNSDQMGRLTPVTTRTTVQDGDTYTWSAQSFDAFANPVQVTRANTIAGQSAIVESTSYLNDPAFWVLGLPVQVINVSTGETESLNGYTAQDQLQSRSRFGQTLMTYTYDGAGQLASFTDGNGHATALSGYQRGLPTTVSYPDQTTEHIGVDDFGQVASITDQAGNTTSYAYDSVGRLAQISYPAGDSVAWAPKVFSYAFVAGAERGIDANHWRRIVTQGGRTDVTYFDALLRPMLTGRYRTGDGGLQTTTVSTHDWHGNVVFQSYAVDGAPNYADVTSGVTTNYDALSRAIQTIQPSETGAALTTTTTYLSGARKQVVDPKGNITTTTYQVFDEPRLEQPVLVQAPEGVVQTIGRDLYGNPTQIVQGGVTKTLVYDAFHRLCRSTEPETASTVTAYDAANNVIWSAKGQALGGTGCDADQVPATARISRGYDALNRVTQITYPDTTPASSVTYTATGKPLTESSDGIGWTFVYNKRDLPTGQSLSVDGHVWPVGYGYDANGALGAVSYPDGKTVVLSPDALGRPTQVGAYATAASYFPDDQLQHATLGSGAEYLGQRNARNLLSNFSYAHGGALQLSEDIAYDNNANITAISDLTSGASRSKTFQYDGLDRLKSATSSLWGTETYAYDALNNIVSLATGGSTNTYNYDGNNLLRSISGGNLARNFNYDARGNVVQNGSAQYSFDQADRLAAVVGTGTYRYDAEGRRVKATSAAGAITYSLYSHDGQLLWQFDPATNSGTDYLYLGKKLIARTNNVLIPSGAPSLSAPASVQANTAYAVSWTATAATTAYQLQEQPDGGAWGDIANTAQLSQSVTHAAAGTFHYQVRSCNAGGCGPWSTSATTTVTPPPSAPAPPATVTATLAGDLSSIGITWSTSATATSYGLQQSFNGGAWSDLYSGSGTAASVANPGDGTYAYQAHACNANGCSAWVAGGTVRVAHIPPAPASINVPGSSTGVVGVSWAATAYATAYTLEQSVNGGGWGAIYSGGATSFSLQEGATGTYSYRVKACNANGCGGYVTSGGVAVTLPPASAPSISAPGSSNNGSWTVSWTGVAGATSYQLSESVNGGGWTLVQANGSGSWSTGGRGDGSYSYVVAACNVAGCGPNSSTVTVSAASIPPVPANPRYTKTYPNRKFENLIFLWDASPGATRYEVRGLDTPDTWTILPPTTSVNVLIAPFGESPPYHYERTFASFLFHLLLIALASCCGLASSPVIAETVTYYYTNPQGTVLATTDAAGNLLTTSDYRPYGTQALGSPASGPGYTGHVNDLDSGLVYMQARYYDPAIGRFLTVDAVTPSPGNLFDLNRQCAQCLYYPGDLDRQARINQAASHMALAPSFGALPVVGAVQGVAVAIADPTPINIGAAIIGAIPEVGGPAASSLRGASAAARAAKIAGAMKLSERSFPEQLAFGICVMERALDGYLQFQQDTGWLGGGDVRAALAEGWRALESIDVPSADFPRMSAAMCEHWAPDSEAHTSPFTSAAIDAVTIACSLLEYIQMGDPKLIRDAAEARRDTLDLHIQRAMPQELSGPDLDRYISNHPLMRNELATMQDDLHRIIGMSDSFANISIGLIKHWRGEGQPSFDILVELEDVLIAGLGDMGDVDGHDMGLSEFNIFIMTDDPKSCFQRCLLILHGSGYEQGLAAGFSGEDDETYTSLWPEGAVNFC
ncbi:hypothetical protein KCV01_g7457, partial [Aureobasidium melanogenum]